MIPIDTIRKGIAASIRRAFSGAEVNDDPWKHIDGAAFIIKCVSYSPERFSPVSAHRLYHFDIVYFAPMDEPIHTMDEKGQRLMETFMFPVEFGGRYIQPQNLSSVKVDKDFHVEFDLDFFDDVEVVNDSKLMQSLEFHLELTPDKGE